MGNLTYTVSGDIASFRSAARVPIESLKCHFKPKQDLHGYDKPWPAGGGENIWDEEWELGTFNTTTGEDIVLNTQIRAKNLIPISANTTYYFKSVEFVWILFYDQNKNVIENYYLSNTISTSGNASTIKNTTFLTPVNGAYMRFYLLSGYGTTYKNDISINKTSTNTSYSPYENICPIEGWNNVTQYQSNQNLWSFGNYDETVQGIRFQANGSSFHITGTNTGSSLSPSWRATHYIELPAGTYTFTLSHAYMFEKGIFISARLDQGTSGTTFGNFNKKNSTFTLTEPHKLFIYISVYGTTSQWFRENIDETVTLQIVEGDTGEDYIGTQEQKWEVEFPVLGKNLFDKNTVTESYRINGDGNITLQSGMSISDYIPVIGGQSYTLTTDGALGANKRHAFYDKDKNYLEVSGYALDYTSPMTLIIPTNAQYIRLSLYNDYLDITQFEYGDTATTYEPYNPDNTAYGGYVDIAKGEVVQTWKMVDLGDYNWSYSSNTSPAYFSYQFSDRKLGAFSLYCSSLFLSDKTSPNNLKDNSFIGSTINGFVFIRNDSITSATDFISSMTGVKLAYELNEPIHYPLSKTELKTFLDQNNIWSNTNGNTEVSYAIHDSAPIRAAKHRIAATEPHIENTSGNMATLNTNIKASLKSAKVHFLPKQDIHGQASPSVSIGKNLLNVCHSNRWGNENFTGIPVIEYSSGYKISNTSVQGGYWMSCEPNTTYTYSYTSTYTGANMRAQVWGFSTKITSRTLSSGTLLVDEPSFSGSATFTTSSDINYLLVGCQTINQISSTVTKVQVEKGDTKTTYEKYKGVFPITGYTSIQTRRTGKNLFPSELYTKEANGITYTYNIDGSLHVEGTASATTYLGLPSSMYFTIIPGTYTLSGCNDGLLGVAGYIVVSAENGGDIKFMNSAVGYTTRTIGFIDYNARLQFVVSKGTTIDHTFYPQLELGSSSTTFESIQNHTIITSDWTDIGTIYGGYIDLSTGELVEEYKTKTLNGSESGWSTYGALERNDFCAVFTITDKAKGNQTSYCDKLTNIDTAYSSTVYAYGRYSDHVNLSTNYFCMPNENITTLAGFKTWLSENPIQIVYKLTNPVVHQLTAQQLKVIKGNNTIWANTNGTIDLQYWKH